MNVIRKLLKSFVVTIDKPFYIKLPTKSLDFFEQVEFLYCFSMNNDCRSPIDFKFNYCNRDYLQAT